MRWALKRNNAVKIAGGALLICLVLFYGGGYLLGSVEFISAIGIPVAGCAVLGWFGYKFLLQPVLRLRKLNRLREYRALQAAARADEGELSNDFTAEARRKAKE